MKPTKMSIIKKEELLTAQISMPHKCKRALCARQMHKKDKNPSSQTVIKCIWKWLECREVSRMDLQFPASLDFSCYSLKELASVLETFYIWAYPKCMYNSGLWDIPLMYARFSKITATTYNTQIVMHRCFNKKKPKFSETRGITFFC